MFFAKVERYQRSPSEEYWQYRHFNLNNFVIEYGCLDHSPDPVKSSHSQSNTINCQYLTNRPKKLTGRWTARALLRESVGGILLYCTNIIIMSVLFIGERSPYYSPQLYPPHLQPLHARRLRQEQYRLDLMHQIREKEDRRRREREAEVKYDREYETYLKRGPAPTIFSTPTRDTNDHNYHFASRIPRLATEGQHDRLQTPTSLNPRKSIFTPSTFDFPQLSSKRPPSRLYTEGQAYQRSPFQEFVASYEKREQELREYEDKKFEEVYSKMHNSVDSLNSEEECEVICSRLKPLRLRLPPRNTHNPEANDRHYRLPPIARLTRSRQRREDVEGQGEGEGGGKWREWYAKEKLKELEEYYQKALIDDQSRERGENDGSRAATPAFPRRSP